MKQIGPETSVIVLELPYAAEALRIALELANSGGGMVIVKDSVRLRRAYARRVFREGLLHALHGRVCRVRAVLHLKPVF